MPPRLRNRRGFEIAVASKSPRLRNRRARRAGQDRRRPTETPCSDRRQPAPSTRDREAVRTSVPTARYSGPRPARRHRRTSAGVHRARRPRRPSLSGSSWSSSWQRLDVTSILDPRASRPAPRHARARRGAGAAKSVQLERARRPRRRQLHLRSRALARAPLHEAHVGLGAHRGSVPAREASPWALGPKATQGRGTWPTSREVGPASSHVGLRGPGRRRSFVLARASGCLFATSSRDTASDGPARRVQGGAGMSGSGRSARRPSGTP